MSILQKIVKYTQIFSFFEALNAQILEDYFFPGTPVLIQKVISKAFF